MGLSRKPLRGMRQLYPEERRVEEYIAGALRRAGEAYGFEEYEAPLIEPLELFLAKTGSELIGEQSYTFEDRGGREVILRPELTPSLARMLAARGEEVYPVRWMSMPVCYRYEKPQRGRMHEFVQFNLDVLGADGLAAELDVILVLRRAMETLGASPAQYRIAWSSRRMASKALALSGLSESEVGAAYSLLDRRDKTDPARWEEMARSELSPGAVEAVTALAGCASTRDPWLERLMGGSREHDEVVAMELMLSEAGVEAAVFDPAVVRGLDYYTGIVFELADTGGENRRALCGGGRYDRLVGLFGGRPVSGVGFGLGLLTLQLFLETYGLVPEEVASRRPADLFLAVRSSEERPFALALAEELRDAGISVEMDVSGRKLGRQMRTADAKGIPTALVVGPDEVSSGTFALKRMETGEERRVERAGLAGALTEEPT